MDRDTQDAPHPTAFEMQQAYRWVWTLVADLSEEQLRWQPNPTTPPSAFISSTSPAGPTASTN